MTKDNNRLDRVYRNVMLVMGIITTVLFLLSLVAMIEFPGSFKFLALAMVISAVAFLVLRSVYNYRNTFRVKNRNSD
jgi:uncharacterized membrane protein